MKLKIFLWLNLWRNKMSNVNTRANRLALASGITSVMREFGTNGIKSVIGDSTNNNRVVSVSQLSRFLRTRRRGDLRSTGQLLSGIYPQVRSEATAVSRISSFRNDALDVNELVTYLRES